MFKPCFNHVLKYVCVIISYDEIDSSGNNRVPCDVDRKRPVECTYQDIAQMRPKYLLYMYCPCYCFRFKVKLVVALENT